MKTNRLPLLLTAALLLLSMARASAQVDFSTLFSRFSLEARADFDYFNESTRTHGRVVDWSGFPDIYRNIDTVGPATTPYGFRGRYFNLKVGGSLNEKFNYYFCQRIVATAGTASLFDNTDFLYLNYKPTKNWTIRMGKDALSVGGFEYDAPPIEVLFSAASYWNNFYCFQPAVSAAYTSNNGNHTIMAQVANSPYVYFGGKEWNSGLLSYNLYWSGNFGWFKTLYSVNMFQRPDHKYMNYVALGNKFEFDNWNLYIDFIHHSNGKGDWGKNYAIIGQANVTITEGLSMFAKGAYEQNRSNEVLENFGSKGSTALGYYDILIPVGRAYSVCGFGAEYVPQSCKDFKVHLFLANRTDTEFGSDALLTPKPEVNKNSMQANIGVTWYMDFRKLASKTQKQ